MHNKSGPTPINYCLNSGSQLPKIIKHANYLRALDRKFQSRLPLALKGMCAIANIRANLIILICYSQLEASKVRMHSRVILQIFNRDIKITAQKLKIIIQDAPL